MKIKTIDGARRLVADRLERIQLSVGADLEILDRCTVETDFGWIFFWNSRRFLESGDPIHALAGNAPLLVDSRDGTLHETSTAKHIDQIIDDYRKQHD